MKAELSNQSELDRRLSAVSVMFLLKITNVAFTSVYYEIRYTLRFESSPALGPIAPLESSLRRNPYPPCYGGPSYCQFNQLVDDNTFAGSEGVMGSCRGGYKRKSPNAFW
jgi:hypothetical protein